MKNITLLFVILLVSFFVCHYIDYRNDVTAELEPFLSSSIVLNCLLSASILSACYVSINKEITNNRLLLIVVCQAITFPIFGYLLASDNSYLFVEFFQKNFILAIILIMNDVYNLKNSSQE